MIIRKLAECRRRYSIKLFGNLTLLSRYDTVDCTYIAVCIDEKGPAKLELFQLSTTVSFLSFVGHVYSAGCMGKNLLYSRRTFPGFPK